MNLINFVRGVKSGDYARTNLFTVSFGENVPKGYTRLSRAFDHHDVSFTTKEVSLPGKQLGSETTKRFGTIFKVANDLIIDSVSMTIICNSDMRERIFFEGWLSSIAGRNQEGMLDNDHAELGAMMYYNDYISEIIIKTLHRDGKAAYAVKLMEAYPTAVSPIQLAWGDAGEVAQFQVTFAIRDWVSIDFHTEDLHMTNLMDDAELDQLMMEASSDQDGMEDEWHKQKLEQEELDKLMNAAEMDQLMMEASSDQDGMEDEWHNEKSRLMAQGFLEADAVRMTGEFIAADIARGEAEAVAFNKTFADAEYQTDMQAANIQQEYANEEQSRALAKSLHEETSRDLADQFKDKDWEENARQDIEMDNIDDQFGRLDGEYYLKEVETARNAAIAAEDKLFEDEGRQEFEMDNIDDQFEELDKAYEGQVRAAELEHMKNAQIMAHGFKAGDAQAMAEGFIEADNLAADDKAWEENARQDIEMDNISSEFEELDKEYKAGREADIEKERAEIALEDFKFEQEARAEIRAEEREDRLNAKDKAWEENARQDIEMDNISSEFEELDKTYEAGILADETLRAEIAQEDYNFEQEARAEIRAEEREDRLNAKDKAWEENARQEIEMDNIDEQFNNLDDEYKAGREAEEFAELPTNVNLDDIAAAEYKQNLEEINQFFHGVIDKEFSGGFFGFNPMNSMAHSAIAEHMNMYNNVDNVTPEMIANTRNMIIDKAGSQLGQQKTQYILDRFDQFAQSILDGTNDSNMRVEDLKFETDARFDIQMDEIINQFKELDSTFKKEQIAIIEASKPPPPLIGPNDYKSSMTMKHFSGEDDAREFLEYMNKANPLPDGGVYYIETEDKAIIKAMSVPKVDPAGTGTRSHEFIGGFPSTGEMFYQDTDDGHYLKNQQDVDLGWPE